MSETSERIRAMFEESDSIRDRGLSTPDNIVRINNIRYGSDDRCQILDIYRPKNAKGKKLPIIVSVHGGGWVYGDKDRYQFYCMNLSQRGFAVVNFTYRLAPEYKFPSSLEDTNLVFDWILKNEEEFMFDTSHIFCVGDSAGAHILGLYAGICTNESYAKQYCFQVPKELKITAIALNCGVYQIDFDNASEDTTKLLMKDLLNNKGTKKELKQISVLNWITSAFPPTFIMTATGDFLSRQAPDLAMKLTEYKVPFLYRFYGDKEHELPHVFHCNIKLADSLQCNDEECNFFIQYMQKNMNMCDTIS